MVDQKPPAHPIHDFATWAPVLRLLLETTTDRTASASVRLTGTIGPHNWTTAHPDRRPARDRMLRLQARQDELEVVHRVQEALVDAGGEEVSFAAEIEASGRTTLHLSGGSAAVETGMGSAAGTIVLVEGSVAEPWRRLPDPVPSAGPAASADPALLERTLRERLPDAVGATEEELAAAEARLGIPLPDELRVLYGVTKGPEQGRYDPQAAARLEAAVGCELSHLSEVHLALPATRHFAWWFGAMEAVVTPPDAAVQGLVGSPGWIVFGENAGGDLLAVDLTPGPRGHIGQIVLLCHEENTGAFLLADSLTGLVLNRPDPDEEDEEEEEGYERDAESPAVAHVNDRNLPSARAAAHPDLEVLSVGSWSGEPLSLAPVIGLPKLRSLSAVPGTLADPLEIAQLTGLEFLQLGPAEWRVLLDARAVPRSLCAAAVTSYGHHDPQEAAAVTNELLALWSRPLVLGTTLVGDLGPA